MKQYSIYDNFTGGFLTHVMAKDEDDALIQGSHYGYEQAFDKKEFIGVMVITPPESNKES